MCDVGEECLWSNVVFSDSVFVCFGFYIVLMVMIAYGGDRS